MDANRNGWMRDVVMQHETSLISYSKSLVWDLNSAREIVQDAFLKLWIEIPPPPEDQVRPWLFTVCRNAAYDSLRKRGLVKKKEVELKLEIPSFTDGADKDFEWRDAGKVLDRLMQVLTDAQAEVIRMKFQEDMSYKEIAKVTGFSVNHVGVLIHQAVSRMREAMKGGGK